jgi:tetratricopeptide (TPR) repeat protein
MKTTDKLIISVLAFFALSLSTYAQSPREQLNQMVQQLQKTPTDNALREGVIKLATEIKPAPAIPEEANRFFVRGNVFQKEAKDTSGYELAISAYREALRIAPWWGDAYFNLAAAQGSAGKFDDAIASLKLFIASVPAGSAEAREAQNKTYALEAKKEMAANEQRKIEENSPQAKLRKDEQLIRSLNGARFVSETNFGSGVLVREIYEIRGLEVHSYREVISNPGGASFQVAIHRRSMRKPGDTDGPPEISILKGREFRHASSGGRSYYEEISEDGSRIRLLWRNKAGEVKEEKTANATETRRVR